MGEENRLKEEVIIRALVQMKKLKETGDDRDYLFFSFLVFSGLSCKEIMGLTWQDLDFDMLEINIRRIVLYSEERDDPMIREFHTGISMIIHLQSEVIRRINPYKKDTGYIFSDSEETADHPMNRNAFNRMWKRISDILDLKDITPVSFQIAYHGILNSGIPLNPVLLRDAFRHYMFWTWI